MTTRRTVLGSALVGLLAACGRPASASRPGTGSTGTGANTRTSTHAYGRDRAQVARLLVPTGPPEGVVVLVHGGYWQRGYDLHLEDDCADDLVSAGWAVWNLDYRPVGGGGGWPGTFADVAAGADALVDVAGARGLALDRVVAVGHSAGGTLALWLAGRHRLPAGSVGAAPRLRVAAVVTQAGVNDLAAGSGDHLGGGAVDELMGGSPSDVPERYAVGDPTALLPLGVPSLAVHGGADQLVPVSQSRRFVAAATAADDTSTVVVVDGEDHFAQLDPSSGVWRAVRAWLARLP